MSKLWMRGVDLVDIRWQTTFQITYLWSRGFDFVDAVDKDPLLGNGKTLLIKKEYRIYIAVNERGRFCWQLLIKNYLNRGEMHLLKVIFFEWSWNKRLSIEKFSAFSNCEIEFCDSGWAILLTIPQQTVNEGGRFCWRLLTKVSVRQRKRRALFEIYIFRGSCSEAKKSLLTAKLSTTLYLIRYN